MSKKKFLKRKVCKCGTPMIFLPSGMNSYVPTEASSLSDADNFEINQGFMLAFNPSRHINHFRTCPFADEFSHHSKRDTTGNNLPYRDD